MTLVRFYCLRLMVIVCVVPGPWSINFPLDGCSTDEMDVLGIYSEPDNIRASTLVEQTISFSGLANHLLSLPNNKTSPRVKFAHVRDTVSSQLPNFNFSSWSFEASYRTDPYEVDDRTFIKQIYQNVIEAITLKMEFVGRLFSEMGGVRENVSHIAVLFLDGKDLSYEESRSVPHIVSQYRTEIKIFVVVISARQEMVHFIDTIIAPPIMITKHTLVMAMCKQCIAGWFMFEHDDLVHYISCYYLWDEGKIAFTLKQIESLESVNMKFCYLTAVETKEELIFLQDRLRSYLEEKMFKNSNGNTITHFSTKVFIGLQRFSPQNAGPFLWFTLVYYNLLPLVVNNWLPGKPSEGKTFKCAVWQFTWTNYLNDSQNISSSEGGFVDGWADINCAKEFASIGLCEVELQRRIETKNIRQIKPASNESFKKALSKGDLIVFDNNIVSVSANIANKVFLRFLQNTYKEQMFPIFDCGVEAINFRYISYLLVCDHVDHCSTKRDEAFCEVINPLKLPDDPYAVCSGVYCCDGTCLPLQWVNDGEVDCTICDYSTKNTLTDESVVLHKYLIKNITCALICNHDQCVKFSQLNDGITDCTGREGPLDETIGKLETADTCSNIIGQRIWAPKCVLVRDIYGGVMSCRDMSHLNLCATFDCPETYFKCFNSYCISLHLVLDGNPDCPTGEDEHRDIIGPCSGNFACWNSQVCLHPCLVCDGHPDCPHGDDEFDCREECYKGFRCVSGTMTVQDYNKDVPLSVPDTELLNTRYIDWSGINLSELGQRNSQSIKARNLSVVVWSNCQISSSDYMRSDFFNTVHDLDLSYNLLKLIDGSDDQFNEMANIRRLNLSYNRELMLIKHLELKLLDTLDLSHTAMANLESSLFVNLPNLKNLNLSFTLIVNFNKNTFTSNLFLQLLDLRGLEYQNFYEDYFNSLTIGQHLNTDNFEMCCPQIRGSNIPSHACHAPADDFSSCYDLIGADTQRVLIWIVASLAVLGNITVIVYRVFWDRATLRTGYGLFVTNLGISDCIMGVYLFIVAVVDSYYRGNYVLYDRIWRASVVCKLAGSLATLSSEASTFFILLITLDRFLVIKFPFGQIQLSKMTKVIAVIVSWVIGFLIALSPNAFSLEIYSSNAVCLGLPLTTQRIKGWEFSFAVFIALNCALCLVIACSQRAIFRAMTENRITTTASATSPRRPGDLIVAKQLSLVALANCLCWFPIGFMALLSLAKYEISKDVYAWTTALILPINSAANPILYTIPAVVDKWDKFKNGRRRQVTT